MAAEHKRLTSWEISQWLIAHGKPASAKEVTEALKKRYPQYRSSVSEVYLRMLSIAKSHNSDCIVNDAVRPRTFHLTRLDDAFFKRCRNPERIEPTRRQAMLRDDDEKERAESMCIRFALSLMPRRQLAG